MTSIRRQATGWAQNALLSVALVLLGMIMTELFSLGKGVSRIESRLDGVEVQMYDLNRRMDNRVKRLERER